MPSKYFILATLLCGCYQPSDPIVDNAEQKETAPFALFSENENTCINFNAVEAINAIVEIENRHFKDFADKGSRYYGTAWREEAESPLYANIDENFFEDFRLNHLGEKDSMHCTIYAVAALKAGMGKRFEELQKRHREIWKEREHAGWSIGYLLVKDWNWKAYSIIDSTSAEFAHVQRAFKNKKEYPVWKQPNIPLEEQLIIGKDDERILALLAENEFGWGFSDQGYHTWISRFEYLKECNWLGAPAEQYDIFSTALFKRTAFLNYLDYRSHVLILPPKKAIK